MISHPVPACNRNLVDGCREARFAGLMDGPFFPRIQAKDKECGAGTPEENQKEFRIRCNAVGNPFLQMQ
jgi:hypothetical protein